MFIHMLRIILLLIFVRFYDYFSTRIFIFKNNFTLFCVGGCACIHMKNGFIQVVSQCQVPGIEITASSLGTCAFTC